jgi:dihydropteroate synthase/2-amino-4-hydroxy-6-hydroxymethyldihydropteridine diphosphokinase
MTNAPRFCHPGYYLTSITTAIVTPPRSISSGGASGGGKEQNLSAALRYLAAEVGDVLDVSGLYSSEPMYVLDQPSFYNCACVIRTPLSAEQLLTQLKKLETTMGRTEKKERYGPRCIDLDIIFYNTEVIDCETQEGGLQVPHPLMGERDFVLGPVCDLVPSLTHPQTGLSVQRMYEQLQISSLQRVFPIGKLDSQHWRLSPHGPTRVMGILNMTPDSFSHDEEGGPTLTAAMSQVEAFAEAGCDVIDIGGESTKPGAARIAPEDELARVLPIIQAIRSLPKYDSLLLSIDTWKATVAREAVRSGVDIVNDVSGGSWDPQMFPTVGELGVPMAIMHCRGQPFADANNSMKSEASTFYGENDGQLIQEVAGELEERISNAWSNGIPRWRLMIDPGLGFSKTAAQSMSLVSRSNELKQNMAAKGQPVLLGPSRKGFLSAHLSDADRQRGEKHIPSNRTWETSAAVTAGIGGGCDVVRVHDVQEMCDVVRAADQIYGNGTRRGATRRSAL